MLYCLHSKAHALPNDTMLNVSAWVVSVLGFVMVDLVTFLSPIRIWKLNILFQVMFMLWSARLVQPFESFAITQAGDLGVGKVSFLSLSTLFSPLQLPHFGGFFPPSPKKKTPQEIPCVERVDSEREAHLPIVRSLSGYLFEAQLAISVKPIWLFVKQQN